MRKIIHIITRLDMGGSAQNTLHTCTELCDTYDKVLVHRPLFESGKTDLEKTIVDEGVAGAKARGVRVVLLPSQKPLY